MRQMCDMVMDEGKVLRDYGAKYSYLYTRGKVIHWSDKAVRTWIESTGDSLGEKVKR